MECQLPLLLVSLGGLVVSQGFLYQEGARERKVRVGANASAEPDAPPEQALEPRANNALIESKSNVFGEFMVSRDIER